ncbi:MAG: autotransporter-associated beta strand repeat-containing protein, partial [Verrucomicrobiae bacterium]|nr:autotransporter-associated beta strand repeat-containing protein [Verrucomicrobiae bacterium]
MSNSGSTTSVVKTGTGRWTISGTNTHTGKTTLQEGILAFGNNNAFGNSTLDLWGGTIQSSDATARTISNAVTVSGDTTFGGTGDLLFTGAVAAGTFPKTFIVQNARTEFSGVISGSGPRTKAGAGTLVLSGSNTYTGPTTVSAGTLRVDGSLAAASAVTVESGGTVTGSGTIHGPVSFASGGALGWSLAENSETAGKLSTGGVTVSGGAVIDLVFDTPGSTVDFSAPFWTSIHTWPVLTSGGMAGLFTLGSVGNDPAGRVLADYGTFYLQQSPQGVSVFFAPIGLVPPDPPSGFTATATDRGVLLAWNESEGTAGYLVLRSVAPGGPYETIATVVSGTSYLDEDALNGTTYYYAVAASNP